MGKGIRKLLPLTLIATGLAAGGVDPALLGMVQPNATLLIGIQASQAQASPIGQYLMQQLQLDRSANQVMTAAGFDPRRDLREILAASAGGSSALLLGRGSFQPAKIVKAAMAAGAASAKYRNLDLLTMSPKNTGSKASASGSFAFLDASTVVAGETEAVKAAIDRHVAGGAFTGPLAERARQISVANDAWLASLALPSALLNAAGGAQLGGFQNLIQSAAQLSAGVKFAATQVTLSAEVLAHSAQDAQSMADLLRFLVGLIPNDKSGPNASKGPSFAESAQISTTGPAMHLVISVPERQLEKLILPDPSAQPKKVALR